MLSKIVSHLTMCMISFQLVKVQKQEKTSTLLKARDNFYKSQNIRYPQAGGRMIW